MDGLSLKVYDVFISNLRKNKRTLYVKYKEVKTCNRFIPIKNITTPRFVDQQNLIWIPLFRVEFGVHSNTLKNLKRNSNRDVVLVIYLVVIDHIPWSQNKSDKVFH